MRRRIRLAIRGAVQGVGFRPFVHRLATGLGLAGTVRNAALGVLAELEGDEQLLESFLERLPAELPPAAFLHGVETTWLDAVGLAGFSIVESADGGPPVALVVPDLATCSDCLQEVLDPRERRHAYPFTNCTNCGPRYTIVESLPYDRPRTSMSRFAMCDACRAEYEDPRDRRFHAQPIACPACGPRLQLQGPSGMPRATEHEALLDAAGIIRQGGIVAILGLGGFHLACDARDEAAVARLRARKHREEKPLAIMTASLDDVATLCDISAVEARLLRSPQAPIVLLRRRAGVAGLAPGVAPGNPNFGVMLAGTPLHHLLLRELGFPIVATSGNLSDEPICTDPREAPTRLGAIADALLVHDRPILRHVDDSVVRVVLGRELVLRRSRGYAPLPVPVRLPEGGAREPVLAVGAHLKSAVALVVGENVFVGQHVGDLETPEALRAFDCVVESLTRLHGVAPALVAADMHPDYASTRRARALGVPMLQLQHHHAHVASCAAENELEGRVLGVAWDGTGWGPDGTVWGGEFLSCEGAGFSRVASFLPFRLPGGEAAVREPRRTALGVLHVLRSGDLSGCEDLAPMAAFTSAERNVLLQALERGVNAPTTTSAGRLFDAAAALAGLRQRCAFEGQAAMELEWACGSAEERVEPYPLPVVEAGPAAGFAPALVADWRPCFAALVDDVVAGVAPRLVALRFHEAMAALIVDVARRVGEDRVLLAGGCFQNRILTERAVARLREAGLRPYWHQRIPPNDGGVALGQAVLALRMRS